MTITLAENRCLNCNCFIKQDRALCDKCRARIEAGSEVLASLVVEG